MWVRWRDVSRGGDFRVGPEPPAEPRNRQPSPEYASAAPKPPAEPRNRQTGRLRLPEMPGIRPGRPICGGAGEQPGERPGRPPDHPAEQGAGQRGGHGTDHGAGHGAGQRTGQRTGQRGGEESDESEREYYLSEQFAVHHGGEAVGGCGEWDGAVDQWAQAGLVAEGD